MNKNNSIITYNVNGYRPVNKALSFAQRLKGSAQDIRSNFELPLIIMLQEVIAGRSMRFLNLLRVLFPEYELIMPAGFDYVKHFKSIMSVTLIRRDELGSYRVLELDSELPNRLCYIIAEELSGLGTTHVINAHIAQCQNFKYQVDWYICERKKLHQHQWDLLQGILQINKDANVIFAGDMQECKSGKNLSAFKKEGYIISEASGIKTVKNSFFKEEACIDHIILSSGARGALGDETKIIYDNSRVGTYSDHTLLCLCS